MFFFQFEKQHQKENVQLHAVFKMSGKKALKTQM